MKLQKNRSATVAIWQSNNTDKQWFTLQPDAYNNIGFNLCIISTTYSMVLILEKTKSMSEKE